MPLPVPILVATTPSSSSATSTSTSTTSHSQTQLAFETRSLLSSGVITTTSALPHTSSSSLSELTPTSSSSPSGGIPYTAVTPNPAPAFVTSPASASSSSSTRRTILNPTPTPTFSDDRENYHRVEFEAPLSADVVSPNHQQHQQQQGGFARAQQFNRFSIDLSLELERELESMESPPVSPGQDTSLKHDEGNGNEVGEGLEEISLEDGKASKGGMTIVPKRGDSLHGRLSNANANASPSPSASTREEPMPDPEILAHIVTQLRQALADMTKERDDLVKMLAETNQRDAETQDALQVMTDKATSAEEEMMEMRRKMKEDEDQIVLLRTKVEESRRGLMRLQTENRRQSMAPIDVARASSALSAFTSPNSAKRASFVPLTGSGQVVARGGHKRGTSVNDSSSLGAFPTPDLTPSPNHAHAFNHIAATEAILSGGAGAGAGNASASASANSRRFSGLFGRQSPPHGNDGSQSAGVLHSASASSATTSDSPATAAVAETSASVNAAAAAEIETLRKALQTTKDELETAKHELGEANEAKEASEMCVKALREFIAENNVGVGGGGGGGSLAGTGGGGGGGGIKLPPPPLLASGLEEPLDGAKKTGSGWGFKLWGSNGGASTPTATPTADSQHIKQSSTSGPYSASVLGLGTGANGRGGQSPVLTQQQQPPASAVPAIGAAPLSRKLGGFFSSRSASVSSNHSSRSSEQQQNPKTATPTTTPTTTPTPAPALTLPQLQTNAALMKRSSSSQRDSMYSYSDTSSVAEPVSPGSDINGLGSAGYLPPSHPQPSQHQHQHQHQAYQFRTGGVPIERVGVVAEEEDSEEGVLEMGMEEPGAKKLQMMDHHHHVSMSMSSVDLDGLR